MPVRGNISPQATHLRRLGAMPTWFHQTYSCTLPAPLMKPGVATLGFAALGFGGNLMDNAENPNVGVILPKSTFTQQVKGVVDPSPSILVLWGDNSEAASKLFLGETQGDWAPVAQNAKRLIKTSFTGRTFSTFSVYFVESPPQSTSCTTSSVCSQGNQLSPGSMLTPPGSTHGVPSVPNTRPLIPTCSSRIFLQSDSSGSRMTFPLFLCWRILLHCFPNHTESSARGGKCSLHALWIPNTVHNGWQNLCFKNIWKN